jgi:hypothetical protein
MMNRHFGLRLAGVCTLAVLALLCITSVHLVLAQAPTDPALQGRLLRRSDGTLYVYLDGVRYPVALAPLSDEQINAIPEGGLVVERLNDLFALGAPEATTTPAASGSSASLPTTPAASAAAAPATAAAPPPADSTAPVASALAALVGKTTSLCGFRGEPLSVTVERADLVTGMDGLPRALLVVTITNVGQRTSQVTAPVHLQDDRGRLYDQSSAGLNPDLTTLARQLGIPSPAPQELAPGLTRRDLWAFAVAPDAQQLTIVPDRLAPCGSLPAPEITGP